MEYLSNDKTVNHLLKLNKQIEQDKFGKAMNQFLQDKTQNRKRHKR